MPIDFPILVSGASGKLGKLVLQQLLEVHKVPAHQIIATSRTPQSLSAFAARGVVVREVDFNRPTTVVEGFKGASRALMISTTWVPQSEARGPMQLAAVEAAVKSGVPHLLYTSAPQCEPGNPAFWHADHYATEMALINSGRHWTILRNWDYPDTWWYAFWRDALQEGRYLSAVGAGGMSYVTREDCAAAAAGALVSPYSVCRRFDVTGGEVVTPRRVFELLAEMTGKQVDVVDVTLDAWEADYRRKGAPLEFLPLLRAHITSERGGWFGGRSDAVEELTGRPPEKMRDFLARIIKQE